MAYTPYDKETIAVTDGGVSTLDGTIVGAGATRCLITCETDTVLFYVNGSTPTTTSGHELYPMDQMELVGSTELTNAKFICPAGRTASLVVTYYSGTA
jgi:hypothetical protein